MSYDEGQKEEFTESEVPELFEDGGDDLDLKDEPDQYPGDEEEGEDDYMSAIMNPNGEEEYSV